MFVLFLGSSILCCTPFLFLFVSLVLLLLFHSPPFLLLFFFGLMCLSLVPISSPSLFLFYFPLMFLRCLLLGSSFLVAFLLFVHSILLFFSLGSFWDEEKKGLTPREATPCQPYYVGGKKGT